MRLTARHPAIAMLIAVGLLSWLAVPASAATNQVSVFETGQEIFANPAAELQQLRTLGVNDLRVFMSWASIAPGATSPKRPKHFNGSSPAAYPANNWAEWDGLITAAHDAGITIDLDLSGKAPLWSMPPGTPKNEQGSNDPSATEFQAFAEAVGKRYSGTYRPPHSSTALPRVSFWSVWNEPNYVSSLHPQGTGTGGRIPNTPHIYRGLVDAAWKGLHASGHGGDTILIGELAPRGFANFGPHSHGYMFPVTFVQSLYCLDSHDHDLRGSIAAAEGCPTTASGSRRFRSAHPGLFQASAFSDHPYPEWYPPTREGFSGCKTGLCSSFADLGNLTGALDKAQRAYGSHKKFAIYSTEYGYRTNPPNPKPYLSPATAAQYINWAEYLSYKNPRIASYDQYLLVDPTPPGQTGDYASGLEMWNGTPKADYAAFQLPLYLPKTTASGGGSLEVWGDARPAHYAAADTGTPQTVDIQFAPTGSSSFSTVQTVPITNSRGYFDVHAPFTQSGNVRLVYTYPASDPLVGSLAGQAIMSRTVAIHVH
jgi:hypothetical protein